MSRPSARRGASTGFTPGAPLGFSLIEVVVVIAIVSLMASMAVPLAAKVIDQSRTEATRKQMEEIHKAIVGDPALGTPGFVGDMGRLPQGAQPLSQLNTQAGQRGGTLGTLGVRMGWWGPYVNSGFSSGAYQNDAWGTPYAYNSGTGQITSYGPDHLPGGGDDITYPPSQVLYNGTLLVNLHVWNNAVGAYEPNKTAGCTSGLAVSLYYSANGAQSIAPTPAGPPYTYTNRHSGVHAVTATCTVPPMAGQAVVFVPGNNQQVKLDIYLK